jgi:hypothetical protein
MRRTLLLGLVVLALVTAAVVGSNGDASAGGSTWVLDREHYEPGDTVSAWAPVAWAHDPELGTPGEGPYHASIVPYADADPAAGLVPAGPAVPVGDVAVFLEPYGTGPVRFGPHHAELSFRVPDLPPGRYGILHANAAGKYIGDLSGEATFWIDAPGAAAAGAVSGAPDFTG